MLSKVLFCCCCGGGGCDGGAPGSDSDSRSTLADGGLLLGTLLVFTTF